MIKCNIYNLLSTITKPDNGFTFKQYENAFWGKDSCDNIAFGLISNDNTNTIIETTKSLILYLNVECEIEEKAGISKKKLNILVLKFDEYSDLFINLSTVFIKNQRNYSFLKYFLHLKDLFGDERKLGTSELQGLFGELYTIYYFKEVLKKDISKYYQSTNRMIFDFSISDTKKMEVKTTLRGKRIHHFKGEQLNSLRYDIKIVSILLQKDDKGLSLYSLIEKSKILFSDSFTILLNIEKAVKNCNYNDLIAISFNEKYLLDNIKVYDASKIPRLTEKSQEGIYNVEFDSDLTNCPFLDSQDIIEWI